MRSIDENKERNTHSERKEKKVNYMTTTGFIYKMYSTKVLCTYIVAFSQEVKCKSISFRCCSKQRKVRIDHVKRKR